MGGGIGDEGSGSDTAPAAIFLQLRSGATLQVAPLREENPMTADLEPEPNTLPARQPTLRVMPMPSDANIHGDVFGGWIMAQVDIAGAQPAVKRANGRVATVAVNSFVFKNPVFVGDLLSFYADVVKVGRTSVTVKVEVYAERSRSDAEVVKVTEATLTYVATDNERKPRPLPPLAS
jgi:acyl-CoA thioesterase YciA